MEKISATDAQTKNEMAFNAVVAFSERLAHDANNYIGAILGLSEVLSAVADSPDEVLSVAGKISAAGRLLQVIINQPLLPHVSDPAPPYLDLGDALLSIRMLAQNLVPPRIVFELAHPVNASAFGISKAEFSTVVFTLLRNAVDAIGDAPGHIRMSLDETTAAEIANEQEHIYRCGVPEGGRYLALNVVDSGTGFPEGSAPRLFQPFVSHARRKTALGLGLNFALAIVERRLGTMEVSRGEETRFTVFIPMIDAATDISPAEISEEAHIVIVDPLAQWGNATAALFATLQRTASCVVSAGAAADILQQASPAPHIVILRAPRMAILLDELQRLHDVLMQRGGVDLLILAGATFPAHPDVAKMLGDMAAVSLGPDAEPADIVNYLISNI